MYKTRLQELCHRRSWELPDYQTAKQGPDHNPSYVSTISVNGIDFQTPLPCRSAKESQNTVAKLAIEHFIPPKPPSSPQSSTSAPIAPPSLPQPQPQPQPSFSQPSFPSISFTLPQPSPPVSAGLSSSGSAGGDVHDVPVTEIVMQPNLHDAFQTTQAQINRPVASVKENVPAGDQKNDPNMQRLYKNQLQYYAQKKNINLPVYSSEREGPPHACRFKCTVTIDGQSFEGPGFFPTLKDAEHAAAKAALMSLSIAEAQEDDIGLYKNLLQELVQKEGLHLPVYTTSKSGEAHMPIFLSKVDIEGEIFTGQEAKTKKQAEMIAAKVAYTILKERKGKSNQNPLILPSAHQGQVPALSSPSSQSNVLTDLQHRANMQPPSYGFRLVTHNQSGKEKESIAATSDKDSSLSDISGCVDSASSSPSLPNNNMVTDSSVNPSTTASNSTCKKVIVYSSKSNVEIAQGGNLLPISDENWVAYSYPK